MKKKEIVNVGDMEYEVECKETVFYEYNIYKTRQLNFFGNMVELPFKKYIMRYHFTDGDSKGHLEHIRKRLLKIS